MTRRRRLGQPHGFTVIEILAVIGIIIILVGILMYGMASVMGSAKQKATATTLNVLRSMVSEFEIATRGLNRQPGFMYMSNGSVQNHNPPTSSIDIWRDGDPTDAPGSGNPEPDPYRSNNDNVSKDGGSKRYENVMVGNTQLVMGLLLQAPGNKKLIDQMSPSQLMEELPANLSGTIRLTIRNPGGAGNVPYQSTAANRNPSPPMVLDGWGNPIIFVPAGGLWDVYAGGVQRQEIKTAANPGPIRSPDGRPFWASAGPDGVFGGYHDENNNGTWDPDEDTAYGDDNIYSFGS